MSTVLNFLSLVLPSRAQDGWTADAVAQAGAVRADPRETSNVLNAPASMSLAEQYAVSGTGQLEPFGGQRLHIQAVDSSTGPVAFGLMYSRSWDEAPTAEPDLPGWRLPEDDLRNPTAWNTIAVGASTRFNAVLSGGASLVRRERTPVHGDAGVGWNLSAGVAAILAEQWTLSLTGQNLSNTKYRFDPLQTTAGARWQPGALGALELDLIGDFESRGDEATLSYAASGEAVIREVAPLRVGYLHDRVLRTDFVSIGLALEGPSGALAYGVRCEVGERASDVWTERLFHGLTLRITG